MSHVSAQGVDERMTNIQCYYCYIAVGGDGLDHCLIHNRLTKMQKSRLSSSCQRSENVTVSNYMTL